MTLTFGFVRVDANNREFGNTISKSVTVTVPAGATMFRVESGAVNLAGLQCGGPVRMKIKANVAGPEIPNSTYMPMLTTMYCPIG